MLNLISISVVKDKYAVIEYSSHFSLMPQLWVHGIWLKGIWKMWISSAALMRLFREKSLSLHLLLCTLACTTNRFVPNLFTNGILLSYWCQYCVLTVRPCSLWLFCPVVYPRECKHAEQIEHDGVVVPPTLGGWWATLPADTLASGACYK